MNYLDIAWEARTNPDFRARVAEHVERLRAAESRGGNFDNRADVARELWGFLKTCNFNVGLLLPWFFPKAIGGKPLSLTQRPFAFSLYDFMVGGETVIRGSRQISKSTSFAGRQLINQHMRPQWRSMYIAPHTEHRTTYANKLRDMELNFRYFVKRHDVRQNLNYKESCNGNGSTIELNHAFTSVSHLRGKTADEMLYDEYQLFDTSFEDDLEQVMKASPLPVRVYSGTSTTIDSPLEARFQATSMGTWHIRCTCKQSWLDCNDRELMLKTVRPLGPTCPGCNRLLNVMDGCWVHHYPKLIEQHSIGYHIPQLIIPDYAHDYIYWSEIYRSFRKGNEDKFLQEILGIPVAEGLRELTEGDMNAICTLGPQSEMLKLAQSGKYKFLVSGCDWGGSDYQPTFKTKKSFTVHAILGVMTNGDVDILHFHRYPGMNYDEIAWSIMENHNKFGAHAIGTDWGVGMFYNNEIRKYIPYERHMVFEYMGPNTPIIGIPAHGAHMLNHYVVNKSEAVTQVVQAIKKKPNRMRCFEWGDSRDYLLDFINMYRVPADNVNGRSAFRFIKNPKHTDDSLHAVSFAYILARILLGEPLFTDNSTRDAVYRSLNIGNSMRSRNAMQNVIAG